jgi:hypothetical protein
MVWSVRKGAYIPLVEYSHRSHGKNVWKQMQPNSMEAQQTLVDHELSVLTRGRPSELLAVRVTDPPHCYLQKADNGNPDITWIKATKELWETLDKKFQARAHHLLQE